MSRPPQVRVRFFPPMIPDLAGSGRRIYSLVSVPHRTSPSPAGSPHSTAYYPLLVHRHGILPRPSFGPHLAVGTLVSANGSCGQARKGLSPSRFATCWAHGIFPLFGLEEPEQGRSSCHDVAIQTRRFRHMRNIELLTVIDGDVHDEGVLGALCYIGTGAPME